MPLTFISSIKSHPAAGNKTKYNFIFHKNSTRIDFRKNEKNITF
ncbi:hypothetical protein KCO_04982 [Pectobacterium brasiliense ICMP 19477]|nr:hypothetical protein KCO_04982 [Pectobacterium brasiliense ICMP 19477]